VVGYGIPFVKSALTPCTGSDDGSSDSSSDGSSESSGGKKSIGNGNKKNG